MSHPNKNVAAREAFAMYDPALDASKLAREDTEVATQNRGYLKKVLNEIVSDRQQDRILLQNWIKSIEEALDSPLDADWNFYNRENYAKISLKFHTICGGKESLLRRGHHSPTALVEKGKIAKEFEPKELIKDLKLETIYDGRYKQLRDTLEKVYELALGRFTAGLSEVRDTWSTPIINAVNADKRVFVTNVKWRRIIAVVFKLWGIVSRCDDMTANTFLQDYPVEAVLRKMGVNGPTPGNTLSHSFSRRQRVVYQADADSESDNEGRF